MPNLEIPCTATPNKLEVTPYIRAELEKRVRATEHLPDSDKRKYRGNTIQNWNNSVKRVRGNS